MSPETIQVLISEDSKPFRHGLRALLRATPDMRLVGEAVDGAEAIQLAERLQPSVILMDLNMPDVSGIEATERILETSPHIAILVLTMVDDDDAVFAAMKAGAKGYLLKGALKDEILRAIRSVAQGEAIFGPAIAQRMMTYFSQMQPAANRAFPELTDREIEILTLMAQGQTNKAIADRLSLSPKTIRNQVSAIFGKLQVANRAEAIVRARDAGLS